MCLGIAETGNSGWPATDVLEAILLGMAGPERYDEWWQHEVPFDHPDVLAAANVMNELVFTPGNLGGGAAAAAETSYWQIREGIIETPPQCAMAPGASFDIGFIDEEERERLGVFRLPSVDERFGVALPGGGQFLVAGRDRPEVREVMRFVASPDFGRASVDSRIGIIPAHRGFDVDSIPDRLERDMTLILHDALDADQFRFDASDMMPGGVGAGEFWDGMVEWFQEGPDTIEGILAELEQTWQDLEADPDP